MSEPRPDSRSDVAIVGAGPYGLAAAAHLRSDDLDVRMFGKPMEYWSTMPVGMLLRSPWHASSISDPDDALTLAVYEQAIGRELPRPVPLDDFIAYGRWFQQQVAPSVDERRVKTIRSSGTGYDLVLDDGAIAHAERVVVATGLLDAMRRPTELSGLPEGAVSHTADLQDPAAFAGRRVLVVGAGQSATECAALLHEAGAEVEIVIRTPRLNWLERSGRLHRSRLRPLFYPDTDVGPPVLNQIINKPRLFGCFPHGMQDRMAYRSIRPAVAAWLRPRLADVPITTGCSVRSAALDGAAVVVHLDDGSERRVDHVLLGTGFKLDVRRHPLLDPQLAGRLKTRNGYPLLGRGYESSVPGLHFIGAFSAISYGPVMRFVSGTWATGPVLARGLGRRSVAPSPAVPRPATAVATDGRHPAS